MIPAACDVDAVADAKIAAAEFDATAAFGWTLEIQHSHDQVPL